MGFEDVEEWNSEWNCEWYLSLTITRRLRNKIICEGMVHQGPSVLPYSQLMKLKFQSQLSFLLSHKPAPNLDSFLLHGLVLAFILFSIPMQETNERENLILFPHLETDITLVCLIAPGHWVSAWGDVWARLSSSKEWLYCVEIPVRKKIFVCNIHLEN